MKYKCILYNQCIHKMNVYRKLSMEAQNDPKKMLVRENTNQEDRVFTVDIIWQNYKGNMSQVMNTNITKLSMQSHFCKQILTKNKSLP